MTGLSGLSVGSMCQSNKIDWAANKLIDHKDEDGDGLVNTLEFGAPPEQFDRMDTNGDDQADKDEIIAFLPKPLFNRLAARMIHKQDTDDDEEETVVQLDTDHDGQADTEQVTTFLPQLNIYQTTTKLLANPPGRNNSDPFYL